MSIMIKGWQVTDRSYVTKCSDPTQVTIYELAKNDQHHRVEAFWDSWKVNGELVTGEAAVTEFLEAAGAPTLDEIYEAFDELHRSDEYEPNIYGGP